jgi:hypothetical protein
MGNPLWRRGRICRLLQLLLVLTSAVILGYESSGTYDHILFSQIRDSPKPGGQDPSIYIPHINGVVQLYPQALGSLFVASNDSQGYSEGIRTHLHAGSAAHDSIYNLGKLWVAVQGLIRPTPYTYITSANAAYITPL